MPITGTDSMVEMVEAKGFKADRKTNGISALVIRISNESLIPSEKAQLRHPTASTRKKPLFVYFAYNKHDNHYSNTIH